MFSSFELTSFHSCLLQSTDILWSFHILLVTPLMIMLYFSLEIENYDLNIKSSFLTCSIFFICFCDLIKFKLQQSTLLFFSSSHQQQMLQILTLYQLQQKKMKNWLFLLKQCKIKLHLLLIIYLKRTCLKRSVTKFIFVLKFIKIYI